MTPITRLRFFLFSLIIFASGYFSDAPAQTISTAAGGFIGDNGSAPNGILRKPADVDFDSQGNLYIADPDNHAIRKVSGVTGVISTVAGIGAAGYSGDNGPATQANLQGPLSVAWRDGKLYISDSGNDRIRMVDLSTGVITTIAGNGLGVYTGDGPALNTGIHFPGGLAFDSQGRLHIAILSGARVVRLENGNLTTVAGTGSVLTSLGDNGPATQATVASPYDVAFDAQDNMYIAQSNRIRKVTSGGTITTFAGTGDFPSSPETGVATSIKLGTVKGLLTDATGMYFSEIPFRIARVNFSDNQVTTEVGITTARGFSGDGGPATQAMLNNPYGLDTDSNGNLYFADQENNRVRKVTLGTPGVSSKVLINGVISTFAGIGSAFAGEGSPANDAAFASPSDVAVDEAGNIYVTDTGNNRTRKINSQTGVVTTIAGTGASGTGGDGGQATQATTSSPTDVVIGPNGNIYISHSGQIRKIDQDGIITKVAGGGSSLDHGVPATTAVLFGTRFAIDQNGHIYIAESSRIRRVDKDTGIISLIAGEGPSAGNNIPATLAQISPSSGILISPAGGIIFIDNNTPVRIRRITDGIVTTIVGGGTDADNDGIPALSANIGFPYDMAFDKEGQLFFSTGNKVRMIDKSGLIQTVAGGGTAFGDGGSPRNARLSSVKGLAFASNGELLFIDQQNHRVRRIHGRTSEDDDDGAGRRIKGVLSLTARVKVEVGPLTFTPTVTVPIDSGFIRLGRDDRIDEVDFTGDVIGQVSGVNIPSSLIQPALDNILGFGIELPLESISDDNITMHLNFRNIDATDTDNPKISPVVVQGDTIPLFFYLRLNIEKNGLFFPRFDFKPGHPMTLRIPFAGLAGYLERAGLSLTSPDDLILAYLTERGLEQEGITTFFNAAKQELVIRTTHLSDLVGLRKSDVPLPKPATITEGPLVFADTTFANVLWRTSGLSNSEVRFGTLSGNLTGTALTAGDSVGVLQHFVRIPNLTPKTRYFYQIQSKDQFGRPVSSAVDSFRTRGVPDLAPPVFETRPVVINRNPDNVTVIWKTDRPATSKVSYDTTKTMTGRIEDETLKQNHRIVLGGLTADRNYFFVVESAAGGLAVKSDTLTFRTPASLDTLPPQITREPRVDDFQVGDTTAIVGLVTNVEVFSEVFYWEAGTTDTSITVSSVGSRNPSVTLTHLKPDTRYVYFVRVTRISNGKTALSRNDRFRTRKSNVFRPLQFTRLPALAYKSNQRVVLAWETNLPSTGTVFFHPDPNKTGVFNIDDALSRGSDTPFKGHRVTVGGLQPGVRYVFVVVSKAVDGQLLFWPPGTSFTTKPLVRDDGALFITGIVQVPGGEGGFTTNSGPDTQAPIILNGPTVVAQTNNTLVIQWETDELSSSEVDFGPGGNLTQTQTDPELVTRHQITLSNLSSNTSYTFQVSSIDPSNNGPTQSGASTGSTIQSSDATPPSVAASSVAAYPSNDRAIVQWNTDEGSNSEAVYGPHPDSLNSTLISSDIVTAHSLTLTGLTASKTYYYRVFSTDVSNNRSIPSNTRSFTTTATPDTSKPVISNVSVSQVARPDSTVSVTFTWTTDRLATSFVDYDTLADLSTREAAGSQTGRTAHTLTVTGLKLSDTYYYQIGSSNAHDTRVPAGKTLTGLDSLTTPSQVDAVAPTTPATVTAIPGNGAVLIRWSPGVDASGIKGYDLTRNGVALVSNVGDTTYLDQTSANGTAYTYTVTPKDNAGNTGTASSGATATPDTNKTPTAPTLAATSDTVSLKPILIANNATPVAGDASRATLTYGFQIATDAAFTDVIASVVGIVQGGTGNPTHWQVIDAGRPDSVALTAGTKYWWRVRASDPYFSGPWSSSRTFVASSSKPTSVEEVTVNVPKAFALQQNAPNPFNPTTTIRFDLPSPAKVTLTVYNLLGQEVIRLLDNVAFTAGFHQVVWNGRNATGGHAASGLYFYRIQAGDFVKARKMTLLK